MTPAQQIQEDKARVEREIEKILEDFYRKTGMTVSEIVVRRLRLELNGAPTHYSAKMTLGSL